MGKIVNVSSERDLTRCAASCLHAKEFEEDAGQVVQSMCKPEFTTNAVHEISLKTPQSPTSLDAVDDAPCAGTGVEESPASSVNDNSSATSVMPKLDTEKLARELGLVEDAEAVARELTCIPHLKGNEIAQDASGNDPDAKTYSNVINSISESSCFDYVPSGADDLERHDCKFCSGPCKWHGLDLVMQNAVCDFEQKFQTCMREPNS